MSVAKLPPRIANARRTLEQRREALLADLRHDLHDACTGVDTLQPDDAPDDIDAGAVMAQSGVHLSLMGLKSEMLVKIDEALARIDEDRYGICESCGSEIPEPRLRALPFALRCTRCEENQETAQRARLRLDNLGRGLFNHLAPPAAR